MTNKEIQNIFDEVKSKSPLIHCITNPISINDCANAVLSIGGKPIMAEHPGEVEEITSIANALFLNLGNITDSRFESIRISALTANKLSIPSIIDLVGITCSTLRLNYVKDLLKDYSPSIIKGNLSEIRAFCGADFKSIGIDSVETHDKLDSLTEDVELITSLATRFKCVVLASGKTDIISDGNNTLYVNNGSPMLPLITGTGCMQGVLAATFLAVANPQDAAFLAAKTLGVCGEIAEIKSSHKGLGTYHIALLDAISTITAKKISSHLS